MNYYKGLFFAEGGRPVPVINSPGSHLASQYKQFKEIKELEKWGFTPEQRRGSSLMQVYASNRNEGKVPGPDGKPLPPIPIVGSYQEAWDNGKGFLTDESIKLMKEYLDYLKNSFHEEDPGVSPEIAAVKQRMMECVRTNLQQKEAAKTKPSQ